MELKQAYDKLKQKYMLPDYDELNMAFEIEDIDDNSGLILQNIRKKMHEKIKKYAEIIENIVQPETNLQDLYEAKYVNDSTKESAYTLFKKLMLILRKSNLVSIENKEKENSEFIKETFDEYTKLKPEIAKHLEKLKNAWQKDTNIKNDLSYFG